MLIDTVGVAGMEAPFEPRIEDNRSYGRGAYDMKGALAAILDAAKVENLRGDVFITAVADEELRRSEPHAVLERARTDAAIVVEPTELKLAIAHKGFVGFERAWRAHGSRPPRRRRDREWARFSSLKRFDERLQPARSIRSSALARSTHR